MECHFEFEKSSQPVLLRHKFPNANSRWLIWFYGGLEKNRKAVSQPLVAVHVRELFSNKSVSKHVTLIPIPIALLGFFPIGSVWRNQRCVAQAIFDRKKVKIDCDSEHWQFTSLERHRNRGYPAPYNVARYPQTFKYDKNHFIRFNLANHSTLVIPCLVFYTFFYGHSRELRRILATYNWSECEHRIFGVTPDKKNTDGWPVRLRTGLCADDSRILSHVLYEDYALDAVKSIYAQIAPVHHAKENRLSNFKEDPRTTNSKGEKQPPQYAYIKVGPWHEQRIDIAVEGIAIGEDNTFLALGIKASSHPVGGDIQYVLDNDNHIDKNKDEYSENQQWAAITKELLEYAEPIPVTGEQEPDIGSPNFRIPERALEVIGTPRNIENIGKSLKSKKNRKVGPEKESDAVSAGEATGTGKGVARLSGGATLAMESAGFLRDIWEASLKLLARYPDYIESVHTYIGRGRYGDTQEPRLISLRPYNPQGHDDELGKKRKGSGWVYLPPDQTVLRGLLVMKLMVRGRSIHIIEIQRNAPVKTPKGIVESPGNQGIVLCLNNDDELESWIHCQIPALVKRKGVAKTLLRTIPGDAATFMHRPTGGKINYELILLHALKKIGSGI